MVAYVQSLRSSLANLFLVAVLGIALTFLVPMAFPQLMHGFHAAHILLHTGGLILALFITTLAVVSYRTLRSRRLLLATIAFANFVFTEALLLAYVLDLSIINLGDVHIYEVGHLLMFVTLGLLALGALRSD